MQRGYGESGEGVFPVGVPGIPVRGVSYGVITLRHFINISILVLILFSYYALNT